MSFCIFKDQDPKTNEPREILIALPGIEEIERLKILIIDDDKAITHMLADYFEGKGETYRVFNKGAEGLEALKKGSFDVVLLDLNMPELADLIR